MITYGGEPGKPFDVSSVASGILPSIPNLTFKPLIINTNEKGEGGTFRQFARYDPDARIPLWPDSSLSHNQHVWSAALEFFTIPLPINPPTPPANPPVGPVAPPVGPVAPPVVPATP